MAPHPDRRQEVRHRGHAQAEGQVELTLWSSHLITHIAATREVYLRVGQRCGPSIESAVNAMTMSLRDGGKLMVCGNGGSAADSQHVAAELTSRLTKEFDRPGIAAVALTTDTSFLTGFANDFGFDRVFERQVRAIGRKGDVLLAISTSGSSANVRLAVQAARDIGVVTVALIGQGGALETEADHAIVVPSRETAHVQEAMLAIEHVLCHALERELFPD